MDCFTDWSNVALSSRVRINQNDRLQADWDGAVSHPQLLFPIGLWQPDGRRDPQRCCSLQAIDDDV